jgi:hypothetical protein
LVTQLDSTARPLSDNQPSAALTAQIGPHPLRKDAELQAGLGEESNVDESPHQPGPKPAELHSSTLQHREILANNGKIALIEITKWWRRRMAHHFAEDGQGCILALLHSNLRDPGEQSPVLIERCRVSNYKDIWMTGNCKVWLNANAARAVHLTSEPFSAGEGATPAVHTIVFA